MLRVPQGVVHGEIAAETVANYVKLGEILIIHWLEMFGKFRAPFFEVIDEIVDALFWCEFS